MFLVNSRLGLFTASPDPSEDEPREILLPKLRIHFAEFLGHESLAHLRMLSSPTCVGLRYGHLQTNYDAFLGSRITLTIPSAEASGYCRRSASRRADLPARRPNAFNAVCRHDAQVSLLRHALA